MANERPVRMCDVCGGVDAHPRHVFAYAGGDGVTSPEVANQALENAGSADRMAILQQIQDNTTIMRHLDCCRETGCPDGTCNYATAGAEDLRGDDLLKHLTGDK